MVQFYRKTEIVNDSALFQVYPDLYIGKEATIEVKGGTSSRRGIFEFVVADKPTFGDALLTAIRPNFYISDVDLNDSTELPRYKGYVFNKHLSDLSNTEGGLSVKDESAVIIESFMSNDGAWMEEKFDGNPRQIGGDVPTLEVESGTTIRTIDKAITVDNLVSWLTSSDITGGDGDGSWFGAAALDEAEYSDDFDEFLEQSDKALKDWLCTKYGLQTDNLQAMGTQSMTGFGASLAQSVGASLLPATVGALAGGTAGTVALPGIGTAVGATAGAIAGAASASPDAYHFESSLYNDSNEGYIIPLAHEKRRGRKDYYRPKKIKDGPNWWIHSKDIDRSGFLIKDVKITKEVESDIDVNTRIHPGNSVFDIVRRQKSYWIADPEDYANTIEAAYTRALFTTAGGLDGQAAQLKCHWRHIDSSEVSDRAKMVPVASGPTIDNRQELILSYGHIPRPNEKDVYHAGAFDVYPQGMSDSVNHWSGYQSNDKTSQNNLTYEKMLDSKVATKVSFTVNFADLEYAWVEAGIDNLALTPLNSSSPDDSTDGFISSRRGFFTTLSRNPIKQGKAGQRAQTFVDYLTDNMSPVTDSNTGHTNQPGTFVLGFLNFPTDEAVNSNDPNTASASGYIHKERQNKISVVWSDWWKADYAGSTDSKSIGWSISDKGRKEYQGHDGVTAVGKHDVRWMGLANSTEDQPTDKLVLLDADNWYKIDYYMHPKVPCIRVHITDIGTSKRIDGNSILLWPGPTSAIDTSPAGIRYGFEASSVLINGALEVGDTDLVVSGVSASRKFEVGSEVFDVNDVLIGMVTEVIDATHMTIGAGIAIDLIHTAGLYKSLGQSNQQSRLGDESRWPAYCSFWLNNTHWQSTNPSVTAIAGNDGPGSVSEILANTVDIFTGAGGVDGTHCESEVLIDNFSIYNANTTKSFSTISNNCPANAISRIPASSYTEIEALYRPFHYFMDSTDSYSYVQDIDSDAAVYSDDKVTAINVGDSGAGYGAEPTVVITGAGGSGATATANMSDPIATVASVTLTSGGSGYKYPPAISFVGGGPDRTARATAAIGTSSMSKEIVKTIPAPRYISIGYDSKPDDMYILYGNVLGGDSTATRIYGGEDDTTNHNSTMSFDFTGDVLLGVVYDADSTSGPATVSQTNPQTAIFSSLTENELVGGKLKIHYGGDPVVRGGDAGSQTAVRDIVAAYNPAISSASAATSGVGIANTGPYVEVWPPLPTVPDAADEWEIQTRANVLFNDLVTREIHDLAQMKGVEHAYSNVGYDLNDDTATLRPSRGIFNLGWKSDCSDITGLTTGLTNASRTITGTGGSPHGTIRHAYYRDGTNYADLAKTTAFANSGIASNGSTVAVAAAKRYYSGDLNLPTGIRRNFTSPVDLRDCDIMVVCKIPSTSGSAVLTGTGIGSNFAQGGAESTGVANMQTLFGKGPGGSWPELKLAQGPQFAAYLRLIAEDTDGEDVWMPSAYGAFCAHKNWFSKCDDESVYLPANEGVKTFQNDTWINLVFPTASINTATRDEAANSYPSFSQAEATTGLEFTLSFDKAASTGGAAFGVVMIAGIYAIPRNVGDIMVGFSNSQNDIGEISKESFIPIDSGLPDTLLDGLKTTTVGMINGATRPKIAGCTVGGKALLYSGYRLNDGNDINTSDTTLVIDSMAGDARGLNTNDRIMMGIVDSEASGYKSEIMRISSITSDTVIVVERGVEGTTAVAHSDNECIYVLTPSDSEVIIKDYPVSVDGFSQKGFASFGFDDESGVRFNKGITWQKRENPLAATRVIEVVGHTEQGVKVRIDQPEVFQCENDTNKTWILYKEASRDVIDINKNTGASQTFTLTSKSLNGDILTLPRTDFFVNMPDETSVHAPTANYFISPYKYWIYVRTLPRIKGNSGYALQLYGRNESPDAVTFPKRSYKSIVRTKTPYKGVSGTHNITVDNTSSAVTSVNTLTAKEVGPTWNESVFNDGKYLNPWQMDFSTLRPIFEQGKDYGYGVGATENPEWGQAFEDNALVGWNEKILPMVVKNDNLKPGDKISFMITPQDTSQRYSLSINSQESGSNTPYLISTYFDGLPQVGDWKIMPDEKDPMFPKFTWQSNAPDSWYGFIKIGTDAIYSQYHNRELHIPMNETTANTLTVNGLTTNVTTNSLTMTREGLAGYAVDFNGTNSYILYGSGSVDPTANCTTYMSIVAHIIPDSGASDNRYIIAQEATDAEKFFIRLNSTNQVEARVWYSDTGYVDLTSGAVIAIDGETPAVIILTVDTTARMANVKLYVNSKLEDQTGLVDSTGTSNNWKTDSVINSGDGSYLVIGNSAIETPNDWQNRVSAFDGKIEEIVIYKDLIYPVDVKSGEYILTKPLKELSSTGKRQSYNAVLFVKDYHNIRGEKFEDVARTEQISFTKSTPAVTGV